MLLFNNKVGQLIGRLKFCVSRYESCYSLKNYRLSVAMDGFGLKVFLTKARLFIRRSRMRRNGCVVWVLAKNRLLSGLGVW
ncbi:hypothetical protein KCP69_17140 [Salmonella enterica subsp. enterica]|nr:hypothetical protein KCP69_17140 [Salmonella enterica subsp. enterica]